MSVKVPTSIPSNDRAGFVLVVAFAIEEADFSLVFCGKIKYILETDPD